MPLPPKSIKPYRSKTVLELSVGRYHSLDTVITISPHDLDWWNSRVAEHTQELFHLIQEKIIVKDCVKDIEIPQRQRQQQRGGDGCTGEGPPKRNEKNNKQQQQQKQRRAMINNSPEKSGKKDESDVRFIFGEHIQIGYQWELLKKHDHSSVTLLFKKRDNPAKQSKGTSSNSTNTTHGKRKREAEMTSTTIAAALTTPLAEKDNDDHNTLTFTRMKKMCKRLWVWCFPFDPKSPMRPLRNGVEDALKPTFIPISALFRMS